MNRVCGREWVSPEASRRRLRHALVILSAVLVALTVCTVAGAESGQPPQPQPLWHAYPLDANPPATRTTPSPARRPASSGDSSRLYLWIALGALGAAIVVFTLSWAGHVGRARERLLVQGGELAGWLRRVGLAAEEGLALAAQGRRGRGLTPGVEDVEVERVRPPRPLERDAARERHVLKQKRADSASSGIEKLKQKTRRPAEEEVDVLKAKLAVAPTRNGRRATLEPEPPAPLRMRRVAESAQPRRSEEAETCRIVLWRGYVKCEFHAKMRTLDGQERVVLASPSFRWRKTTPPPPDVPEAAQAYEELVTDLEARGWVATPRRRDEWYSVELKRPVAVAFRPAKRGEQ
jgi:hypothetical protein